MKILMINPPFMPKYSRQSRSPCVTKGGTFYYPYYLAYATGVLDKGGYDVKLVDAIANEWNKEETMKFIKEFKPDLYVSDTSIPSFKNDVEFASKVKDEVGCKVCLVGAHRMDMREAFRLSDKIDFVCRGEYDYTVRDLVKALESGKDLGNVLGLSYRKGNKIINNKDRQPIENLDELPFVSWVYKKHFGKDGIKKYFYASLRWPQVTILTARGCPYNCSFCPIPFKGSYRSRSPENVLEEFKYIKEELPFVKEVMLEDDTFPVVKSRTLKISELLIKNRVKLKWSCNARVNTDYETLKKMKEAGCRLMCVGFETPTQKVLDNIHKGTTENMQFKFMKDTKKLGMLVNGCFILGLPGDDKESIQRTIEFAKRLNCDTAQFYPLMVYPGTEAYDWAKRNGYLETEDYTKLLDDNGQHSTILKLPNFTSKDLVNLCYKARKEYYLRWNYILYKIWQGIKSPEEAIRTLKSAKVFFKHLKSD